MDTTKIDRIIQAVSVYTLVPTEDILSRKRSVKDGVIEARFLLYSILRDVYNLTLEDVQAITQRRTHGAVLYGLRSVQKDLEYYTKFLNKREAILEQLDF